MTIDEAIAGLQGEVKEAEDEGALKAVAYLRLGIEALKLIQRERLLGINPVETQLPGETEEVKDE